MSVTFKADPGLTGARRFKPFSNAGYMRISVIDVDKPKNCTGLARFLSESLDGCAVHSMATGLRVSCYGKKGSMAENIRRHQSPDRAERMIEMYGVSEDDRDVITDWMFPVVCDTNPDKVWNGISAHMIRNGVDLVKIRITGFPNDKVMEYEVSHDH